MKFERVDPPDETADAEPRPAVPADHGAAEEGPFSTGAPDQALARPVGERMARTLGGVRASLNLLAAQAAERCAAEADRLADVGTSAAPEAVFRPERFSAAARGEHR